MNENVNIRRFKLRDLPELVTLLGKEWDSGKKQSKAKGNICAWIYAFELLSYDTETFTCEENGEIAGFIGYTAFPFKWSLKKLIYFMLYKLLFFSPSIKNSKRLKEYYDYYDYISDELQIKSNCSLNILIVDSNFRGRHLGQQLFDFIVDRTKKLGITNLLIATDDSCSVEFYVKNNCVKIKDIGTLRELGNDYGNEKAYIYCKKL